MPPKSRASSADLLNDARVQQAVGNLSASTVRLDMDAVRLRQVDQFQSTLECRRIVDSILQDVDDEIVRSHVDRMTVPWTVQSVLTDLFEALQVAFPEREPLLDSEWDDPFFSDVVDDISEPLPIAADPWSRGAMQKRKPITLPSLAPNTSGPTASTTLQSQGSGQSPSPSRQLGGSRNKKDPNAVRPVNPASLLPGAGVDLTVALERPVSAASSAQRSLNSSSTLVGGSHRRPQLRNLSAQIKKSGGGRDSVRSSALDSHRSDSDGGTSHVPVTDDRNQGKRGGGHRSSNQAAADRGARDPSQAAVKYTEEELAIIKQHKEMQQRMNVLRRTAERVDHQLAEVLSRANNSNNNSMQQQQQSGIVGAAFVIDGATNTVITVQPVDPSNLPARSDPKVVIDKDANTKGSKGQAASQDVLRGGTPDVSHIPFVHDNASPSPGGKGRAVSPAQALQLAAQAAAAAAAAKRTDISQFYTQEAQIQPMITDLQPAAGVATKEGEAVKRNELKLPKGRMTKADFSKLVAVQASTSAATAAAATSNPANGTSTQEAPVSPPLSSVRRKSITGSRAAGAAPTSPGLAASEPNRAATPPAPFNIRSPRGILAGHPSDGSNVLERPPSRVLTPQPTAALPSHQQSSRSSPPSRGNSPPSSPPVHRAESATRNAAARVLTVKMVRKATANKSRTQRLAAAAVHAKSVSEVEDEGSREFLSTLVDMGDFEEIPFHYSHDTL